MTFIMYVPDYMDIAANGAMGELPILGVANAYIAIARGRKEGCLWGLAVKKTLYFWNI